jgi:hypothetical protein
MADPLAVLTRTAITATGRAASSAPSPARYVNVAVLCTNHTIVGVTRATSVLGVPRRAVQFATGPGGAGTARIEGSMDPDLGWVTMAYGSPGLGGYTTDDIVLSPGGSQIFWLAPEDWVLYVRVNLVTSTLVTGLTAVVFAMED